MGHYAGKPAIDWHEGLSVVPAGGAFGVAGGPAFVSKDFIFFLSSSMASLARIPHANVLKRVVCTITVI